jgi:hypothetical protein
MEEFHYGRRPGDDIHIASAFPLHHWHLVYFEPLHGVTDLALGLLPPLVAQAVSIPQVPGLGHCFSGLQTNLKHRRRSISRGPLAPSFTSMWAPSPPHLSFYIHGRHRWMKQFIPPPLGSPLSTARIESSDDPFLRPSSHDNTASFVSFRFLEIILFRPLFDLGRFSFDGGVRSVGCRRSRRGLVPTTSP